MNKKQNKDKQMLENLDQKRIHVLVKNSFFQKIHQRAGAEPAHKFVQPQIKD